MGKFIIMQDMRALPSYKNVNARLIYMHVAMSCDVATYTYATSIRKLAAELDMTVDAIRHGLKILERDGLITPQRAPQRAPQGAPQGTPQRAPHLTVLRINKNGTTNGTPNPTPNPTGNPTGNPTDNPDNNNNNNKIKNKTLSHTHVRERAGELGKILKEVFRMDEKVAASAAARFLDRQAIKGKKWENPEDLKAHLVSWVEKRLKNPERIDARPTRSDHEARVAELQRATEPLDEAAALDAELRKLERWRREAQERGDSAQATMLEAAISEKRNKVKKEENK